MNDLIEYLLRAGFTEYEAKAYIALQGDSPATGYQIAKDSGIPRSMVYEVLGKLVARGAAFTQSFGDMVRYAPVPPDLLLDRMRHEFEDTLDKLGDGFKRLASLSVVPGQAWNVTGRDNILAQARQMIEQAQSQVVVVVGDDDELDELVDWLKRAHSRGLNMVVISPVPYDVGQIPVSVHPQGQHLRHTLGHGITLIVDEHEMLMGEVDRSQSAVWTTNSYAVAWALWYLRQEMSNWILPDAESGRRVSSRKSGSARKREK